ncbi:MAG: ATP-binding protein, partial [Acidobacteriota bacterium]
DLLYLAAFILPLQPLWGARRVCEGSERVAWTLLFVATLLGLLGHLTWMFERLVLGSPTYQVYVGLPQVGYSTWIMLMAIALALEVSSGGRPGVRAELVIDLLLIGAIGMVLAAEIFQVLPLVPASVQAVDLVVGSGNLIAAMALAVAALGILMSPAAMGGGVSRLLIVFGAFAAGVARLVFAYELVFGSHTLWLEPVWIFSLLIFSAAAAERTGASAATESSTMVAAPWSPLRTMVVPVIIAYALSLLIREILGSGGSGSGQGLAWGMLALLIVARVTIAIMGSERQAQEVSAWEHRYATVVQALGEVVYEWDPKSGRVLRSGNIGKVFGYRPEELAVADTYQSLGMMHEDDREPVQHRFQEVAERGGWFEIEYRVRHADGTYRLIRDRGVCDQDEVGKPVRVLGIMSDITDARENEERLQRAERLASLGGLAAGAAHEINNPLAAIALAAQMLQEDDRLPEDVRDDVRVIERQASRAGEVTDRMLVFARRKEGERSLVDLNDVVEEILRGRRYDLETHGVRLEQSCATALPPVWADVGQIERALLNLLVNAERALHEVPEGRRWLRVGTEAIGGGVVVTVSDNGAGIPAEVLPHIFDPFFTTREVGEGTGLGLSMSYGIAQSHGGELRVQTRAGAGTTFTLELPAAPEHLVAAQRASASGTAVSTAEEPAAGLSDPRQLGILLVEDEPSLRDLARRFLEQKGHAVDEADSGRTALRLVAAGDYDTIILDLRMPDLSGEGLYEWLKKHRPELAERVIVISGDVANPDTPQTIERMGRPFLLKPFDLDELEQLIERSAPAEA